MTIKQGTLAFAGYTLLALVMTHPLVWHLSTRVPHDLGDPLLTTTILSWSAHHTPLTTAWWDAPFFWPATGALTFSDHRLGESLLASPLQWAGLSPLASYNITLLATFPLCALAAHWLAYTLTTRHDAAMLAGLAYGFSPYRFAHIEHLELLAAFGMPVALLALHRHVEERRASWLIVFGVALLVQALSCSYYFLFFLVMLTLWVAWFIRRDNAVAVAGIAVAVAIVAVVISPIALAYLAVHDQHGLVRQLDEIVAFSADVTSPATAAPISALWGWTSALDESERQLFPGATITAIVAIAIVAGVVSNGAHVRGNRVATALAAIAGAIVLSARRAFRRGWSQGGAVSATELRPLSLAFVGLVASVIASSWVRGAYRRRSAFTFYALAAAALFVFSLGPRPTFLGRQLLFEAPYAWLMRLPVFRGSVRVPARFAMPAILALSTAGALAFARLTKRHPPPALLAGVIAVGIVADAWISRLPLLEPPSAWPAQVSTAAVSAFVELPLGETTVDAAAMYRSMMTGLPTINGYSGFAPQHYHVLARALDDFDESALDALAGRGRLLVVVRREWPYSTERLQWLRGNPNAHEIWANSDSVWFIVSGRGGLSASACGPSRLPIAGIRDRWSPLDLAPLQDDNDATFWMSAAAQRSGDALILDLGRVTHPCAVRMTLGSHAAEFPRMLSVATSADGGEWQTSFSGKIGGQAVMAAVKAPRRAVVEFQLPDAPARFIRLQLEANQPKVSWVVTEFSVTSSP